MRDHTFRELRCSMQNSGVAPRHIRRMVLELHDHLDDLKQEAVANGCDPFQAHARAVREIGDQKILARKILEHSELKTWVYRYPRVARLYYPVAYVLLLPAAPVFAGVARASMIARWGAALMLSATVTAAMFLAMQLSIALG